MTCTLYLLLATVLICISIQIFAMFTIKYEIGRWNEFEVLNSTIKTLAVSDLKLQILLSDQRKLYNEYLNRFGKRYGNDELLKRFEIFKESLSEISRLNKLSGANYGLTKFSDVLLGEGFNERLKADCRMQNNTCTDWDRDTEIDLCKYTLKKRFDWRDQGMVGPVLNQKKCNGCWAFGVVGAMESQAAIFYKQFGPSLSVQELIDCSNETSGCNFGHVRKALEFLCSYKWGIIPEYMYPLKLFKQDCKINPHEVPPVGLRILKYWYLCSKRDNEEDLLRLVHRGPVIVVVNAAVWLNYIDGVIQMECSRRTESKDHVVQIVGYDREPEDGSPPHYIVKNSWGSDFGDEGYVKLAIGGNVCGVADEVALLDVYYPL